MAFLQKKSKWFSLSLTKKGTLLRHGAQTRGEGKGSLTKKG